MDRFEKKAAEIVSQMTNDEKLGMLSTHQNAAERFGLGEFFIGTEVARGYVGRKPEKISTVFPQPVGLAATFDRELMHLLGSIAGKEARAYYNDEKNGGLMLWGPTVDMERDPRWGRTEEAYGEDVFLAGELTAQYTSGMAGITDEGFYMTVPTLKHFCANNNENDRGSCDAFLPPRLKHEYYYAAFENAVRNGGARSIMTAYNEINGLPAIMNPDIEDILKKEWGLWFTVSDGGDMSQNLTMHRYCDSMAEAFAYSLRGGCDVMTDAENTVRAAAEKALERGLVSWEDIDRSVTRTVTARLRLGQLSEECPFDGIDGSVIDCAEHRRVNLRAALEQIVLLKNNGILPVRCAPEKIAVVGGLADENLRDWYTGYFSGAVSVYEGIKREFPDSQVHLDTLWDIAVIKAPNGKFLSVHEDGTVYADAVNAEDADRFEIREWGDNWNNLFSVKYGKHLRVSEDGTLRLHNAAVYDWFTMESFALNRTDNGTVADDFQFHRRMCVGADGQIVFEKQCAVTDTNSFDTVYISRGKDRAEIIADEYDLVVLCVGNHPVQTAKECYDRKTLTLEHNGLALNEKNTVMVLISSYPYAINEENKIFPAVIYSTHAGAELGNAVAQTISGKNNPSGHLPMTWYRSEYDLPDIHEYDIAKAGTTYMYFRGKPLYPFGYGLSYSEFRLSETKIEKCDGGFLMSYSVENISDTDGIAVVQVYYTADGTVIPLPERKLCGFDRVYVRAGDRIRSSVKIPSRILEVFDVRSGKNIIESGRYRFSAGFSSADIRCSEEIFIEGETVGMRPTVFSADSFEDYEDIRICHSRKLGRYYVLPTSWVGRLVYGGVPLEGAVSVKLSVSALNGGKAEIEADGETFSAEAPVSDSRDDFEDIVIPLGKKCCSDKIKITLAGEMSLLSIEILYK